MEEFDSKLETLKEFGELHLGSYRIYISINPRSKKKAWLEVQHQVSVDLVLGSFSSLLNRLSSSWKSYLARPQCKAKTRFHMVDIDHRDKDERPGIWLESVSGYHLLVQGGDPAKYPLKDKEEYKLDSSCLVYCRIL